MTTNETLIAAYVAFTAAVNTAYPLRSQAYSTLFNLSQLCLALITALDAYIAPLEASASSATDMANMMMAKQARASFANFENGLQKLLGTSDRKPVAISAATSLYAVAAKYYPQYDVVETAQAIAQANGLTSFFVEAGQQLYLPPIFGTNVYNSAAAR